MKKSYILIIVFIIFIIFISIIGSIIVTGNTEIKKEGDILSIQYNKEVYFTPYGYSIDNPNVIVNPYGNSPLTAIIMFTTDSYSEVSITVKSKSGNSDINHTFSKNKYHYIPIYGLYADYDNTVILRSAGKEKIVNIKTEKLPDDFLFSDKNTSGNFTFYNINYPYAVDSDNEVRWYFNRKYYGNISLFGDSSIIIGSDRYDEDGNSISLYKMNFLGKIYSEYIFDNSYYGFSSFYNNSILALSDKVLLIDPQTGEMTEYADNDSFSYLGICDEDIIIGKEDKYYKLLPNDLEEISYNTSADRYNFYNDYSEYSIVKSSRFGNLRVTELSSENIPILSYDKGIPDGIEITSEIDRMIINNNEQEVIYVILDKFLDKRVYEVNNVKYINFNGLSGKYTIYIKVNDKIYKTDYFIEV
ncbi:MAG: aryl-sulfate sulfotransferase [Bacilli bacterium]